MVERVGRVVRERVVVVVVVFGSDQRTTYCKGTDRASSNCLNARIRERNSGVGDLFQAGKQDTGANGETGGCSEL